MKMVPPFFVAFVLSCMVQNAGLAQQHESEDGNSNYPLLTAMDTNQDGQLSADEIANARQALQALQNLEPATDVELGPQNLAPENPRQSREVQPGKNLNDQLGANPNQIKPDQIESKESLSGQNGIAPNPDGANGLLSAPPKELSGSELSGGPIRIKVFSDLGFLVINGESADVRAISDAFERAKANLKK